MTSLSYVHSIAESAGFADYLRLKSGRRCQSIGSSTAKARAQGLAMHTSLLIQAKGTGTGK